MTIVPSVSGPTVLPQYDRDLGFAGVFAPLGMPWGSQGVALTANRAYLARFVPSRNMTITKIAFAVSTAAGADDACDVGIYSADLATKLVSAGATSGKLNATGPMTITVASTLLTANTVYYAAFSSGAQGGTAAQVQMTSANGQLSQIFGSGSGQSLFLNKDSAHALPSSISSPAATGSVVVLAVRES